MNLERTADVCIDRATLTRYMHGKILSPESSSVSLHLLGCERCVSECESLMGLEDEFEAQLKGIDRGRGWSITPDCERMLSCIQSRHPDVPPSAAPSGGMALVQDQGSPPDHAAGTGTESVTELTVQGASSDVSKREVEPKSKFGRYQIQSRLGAGGMAAVFKAYDTRLNRLVALKIPHRSIQVDHDARARFQQEAHAAAAVSHPGVCGVLDIGEEDGLCYLTMPLLEGESLADRLKREPPLTLQNVLDVVCELCAAVDAIHAQCVIHRDIKPANVFLTTRGHVILMDFGIALASQGPDRLTQTGLLMGTPAYFSPEQAAGDWSRVGPSADLYSAGVVLYELLGGDVPFRGPPGVVVGKILHEAPPPLVSRYVECDLALSNICSKAMAKVPTERFARGADLAEALAAWRINAELRAKRSPKWNRNSRVAISVLILVACLVLVVIKLRSQLAEVEIVVRSGSDSHQATSITARAKAAPKSAGVAKAPQAIVPPEQQGPVAAVILAPINETLRQQLPEFNALPPGLTWVGYGGPGQLPIPAKSESVSDILAGVVSGDGSMFALLHAGPAVSLWEAETLKRQAVLTLPKNDTTLSLSGRGEYLLTAGGGWRVRVWDMQKLSEIRSLAGHMNWINTLASSTAGDIAVSTSKDGTVRCWSVQETRQRWAQKHGSWARSVAIDEAGKRVISGGQDGHVRLWGIELGEEQSTLKVASRPVVELVWNSLARQLIAVDLDGAVSAWDLERRERQWHAPQRRGHPVRLVQTGKVLAVTAAEGAVQLLDTATGQSLAIFSAPPHGRTWSAVGFVANPTRLIMRSSDQQLCVLKIADPAPNR